MNHRRFPTRFASLPVAALATLATLFTGVPATAQKLDPVHWTLTADNTRTPAGSSVVLHLKAQFDEGWHLYSLTTPKGGPIATTAALADNPAVQSFKLYQPPPFRKFDPNFKLDTETFDKEVDFPIVTTLSDKAKGAIELEADFRYQACNDRQCLPPRKKTATIMLTVDPAAPAQAAFVVPSDYTEITPGAVAVKTLGSGGEIETVTATGSETPAGLAGQGIGMFILTAFGFGLAAIFTPCVFPMIPITVSFFVGHKGGISHALAFALGIIGFFCIIGLGATAIAGPAGVNYLNSSPWVNGFITLVFGVLALSLLGAFELTLPSGLLTKVDAASRRGGYAGTLLMGLTFSLTSFACIGPFMGSLLVASVQQSALTPVLGMASFATGLAAPFFFLAAFPKYLKALPKSGGWLARVKVVMGFVLLAIMLKYASNIDQKLQLGWLTRERFLAGWFVLFAMAGLYLLGLLRLEGIERDEPLKIGRLMVASALLIFAISLLPGMFGAPLPQLDAYVPPVTASVFRSGGNTAEAQVWMKDQYREALAKARAEKKLVLVTFTGVSCTNCHWMKANMFPRPQIAEATKALVLVELYTDGTDEISHENERMQESKFQTVAIPYYAILDPDGNVVSSFAKGMTEDTQEFLKFLTAKPAAQTAANLAHAR
jgi:thiol:disulfide interchange protein DsbD